MHSDKPRLRFHVENVCGGQLAHENNEYFTPRKLHAYNVYGLYIEVYILAFYY